MITFGFFALSLASVLCDVTNFFGDETNFFGDVDFLIVLLTTSVVMAELGLTNSLDIADTLLPTLEEPSSSLRGRLPKIEP
jgi:hypothetical protein